MSQQGAVQSKPGTAYVLSLIGSILMLISAIVIIIGGVILSSMQVFFGYHRFYPIMPGFIFAPAFVIVFGIIGLIVSALALYFSIRLSRLSDVDAVHNTGIVLLILSIVGLFTANGFIIGFILLLVGSILALTWKP
ncbi:MAG: hypothetical protein TU36_001160 [Vulcanisaeta sp. AZ3]|jgi:NO-binding membrane sensor protein with MHYT domain